MAPVPAPSVPGEAPPPGSRWSYAAFADIDEQAAALQGWNQEYLQLSPGVFSGVVQRLQLDGVGLFVEDLQQVVHQTGHVRPDVVVPENTTSPRRYLAHDGMPARFYVDSLVHDADALNLLLKLFGAERIAFGSDYPFSLGEIHPGKLIDSMKLAEKETAQLFSGTVREFLGLTL